MPTRSSLIRDFRSGSGSDGNNAELIKKTTPPNGKSNKNIHRHDCHVVNIPPTIVPVTAGTYTAIPYSAIALSRRLGNALQMSTIPTEIIRPLPSP